MKNSLFLVLLAILSSCSSMKKSIVRSNSDIFEAASNGIYQEKDYNWFKESTPALIKQIEGIYQFDKENLKLLSLLIKSYAGYAYAVSETKLFAADYSEAPREKLYSEVLKHYSRAYRYGLDYLDKIKINIEDWNKLSEEEIKKQLKSKLRPADISAVLFFGQAWGSLIQWQKTNVGLISDVAKVKIIFDHVCEINPNIEEGFCSIFYAQYEASRPKLLGGNPEKGRVLFLEAIKKFPENPLVRIHYLQYSVIPSMDEEAFDEQTTWFEEFKIKFEESQKVTTHPSRDLEAKPECNFFKAISLKRFEIINENKKKLF
jgi:hypothetical protein